MYRLVLILGLLFPDIVPAQSIAPSFDCARAESDAEVAICANDRLAQMDLELSRLYHLALVGQSMDETRRAELRQSQRDWIRDRRECWKASVGLETCVGNAYAIRIHDLREAYAGARSDDDAGISSGPFAYRCIGFDALISVVFVNADEQLVSLRWLDRQLALPRVPSGSGTKYQSDIWVGGVSTFWAKGEEALFAAPGKDEMKCTEIPAG